MAADRYEHYLRDGQLPAEGRPELLAAMPHLRPTVSSHKPWMLDSDYHRERKVLSRRNH